MIDVHCHLNLHSFDEDYAEVASRAFDAGVKLIVNTGTSIPSSRRAVELAQKFDKMYAIVGVHPHHADKADIEFEGELQKDWFEELKKLVTQPKVIGIGEIGMDYFRYKSNGIVDKKIQEATFRQQIELAIDVGLPLQIHNRQAGENVIRILKDYKSKLQDPPGMFHCFAGTHDVLHDALDLGFYIGFDGNTTYKGIAPGESVELRDLVKEVPLDRMMTETDSPFLPPVPLRGTRNEPKNVIIIGEYLAQLKGIGFPEFSENIYSNFEKLFKIKV
ncbi:MAG TPA: TatD family hydrolase [Patescibacteria group bacterium]|nr:TatD family hydrolase [Patescibacteria group bacterium]